MYLRPDIHQNGLNILGVKVFHDVEVDHFSLHNESKLKLQVQGPTLGFP
jgi:hypothetical protein